MTLQQLKYVITVANTGTITEAANQGCLFPSESDECDSRAGKRNEYHDI